MNKKPDTVRIDRNLLERVEKITKDIDRRIIYSSKRQFVNIAVLRLLQKEEEVK